ncbi:MAG: single-stranded DNA-binding protein [Nitrosomonas sp.]|nr:single-stranded DNA-binding protein [Nitrosomonas sp.]
MINKAILVGNVGKKGDMKKIGKDGAVMGFSIATSESWTDQAGKKNEKTEWHEINTWGKLAEICDQYISVGKLVYVEGRIETRSWDDEFGNKKYKTSIVASKVQFLSGPVKEEEDLF